MGCCGQKRSALRARRRAADAQRRAAGPAPPAPAAPSGPDVAVVEYLGDPAVLVGVGGGRLYTFAPGRRERTVPVHHAQELLRNPLFRQDERRTDGTRQKGR
jgi:hypothetical protein